MLIPSDQLTLDDVPGADASDSAIIRFAHTLNGYDRVEGGVHGLGAYVERLKAQPPDSLALEDLRILLFARQRAHYHEGGGWPDGDPIMDEMRALTLEIRSRVERRANRSGGSSPPRRHGEP